MSPSNIFGSFLIFKHHFCKKLRNIFFLNYLEEILNCISLQPETESIAQLVRASDCGSEGRGFETHCSPKSKI